MIYYFLGMALVAIWMGWMVMCSSIPTTLADKLTILAMLAFYPIWVLWAVLRVLDRDPYNPNPPHNKYWNW
jgi:hypothetical protein